MTSNAEQKLLRTGAVVAGKYRIDQPIARGGFSIVYRATHIDMQRPVGLKILTINEDIRASWLERFTREARLASQLTHPNTVTIYDYGQDPNGFLYIAMEWVEGVSLYQYLTKRGALGATAVARISVQILESLQEAHQLHFLHRDLKPSNIMLTHDYQGRDTVKVLDFGIAKDLREKPDSQARITHQGAFVGTPRYASPEQLNESGELGPASDIYSLGLLMWEALVGDPAISSTRYGDCVERHLSPEPWRLPPSVDCPIGFDRIFYKALAKDPAERYQRSETMRAELIAWLDSPQAKAEDNVARAAHAPFSKPSPARPPALPDDSPNLRELLTSHQPQPKSSTEADPLTRDLARLAEDAHDNRRGHPARAHNAAPAIRRAAPVSNHLPAPKTRALRSPRPIIIGAALALGVLLVAFGGWILREDSAPPANVDRLPVALPDDPPATPEPAPPVTAQPHDLSYSPALIWAAVQESGWKRIGRISTSEVGAVTLENGRFRKKNKTVAVTIYSTDALAQMPDYSEVVEPPIEVIGFGTTVVQVAPGTRSGDAAGIRDLMVSLRHLKEIAEDQARERALAD